jgi:hypothetical protein
MCVYMCCIYIHIYIYIYLYTWVRLQGVYTYFTILPTIAPVTIGMNYITSIFMYGYLYICVYVLFTY